MPNGTQRLERPARRLDRARTIEQAKRGLTHTEIAHSQGVNQKTVWRFLDKTKPEIQALERFKANRADLHATLQAQCLDVQSRILATFKDGVIDALKTSEKSALLFATNAVHGTSYDKERLERGLSTEQHSIVTRLLVQQVKELYTPKAKPTPLHIESKAKQISEAVQAIESTHVPLTSLDETVHVDTTGA